MVVNSCFEQLERRVGLKRVWEFVPKAGKKNRNERVKFWTVQWRYSGQWVWWSQERLAVNGAPSD